MYNLVLTTHIVTIDTSSPLSWSSCSRTEDPFRGPASADVRPDRLRSDAAHHPRHLLLHIVQGESLIYLPFAPRIFFGIRGEPEWGNTSLTRMP